MNRIYILDFEQEKIASIALGEQKIIRFFELEEDAYRYGLTIQGLPRHRVISVEFSALLNYAKTTSYIFQIMTRGTLVTAKKERVELVEWFTTDSPDNLKFVYILLFTSGDTEGVHSLKIANYDIVLLFEAEDDAIRYGLLLEAQDFPTPNVEPILIEEAIDSCSSAGYAWQIVKKEGLTVPPATNLELMDWQKPAEEDASLPDIETLRRKFEGLL